MKQKYKIRKGGGVEVEGDVFGVWGIDKRDKRYILTHVPTGYLVESARTMRFLKELILQPEFQKCSEVLTLEEVNDISKAITRLRAERGWTA